MFRDDINEAWNSADYKKIRAEFNTELEESTVGTTKEFKNVISSLAKTRPEAAKIVSEFKGLSADTFKGAVLNRDLIKGMSAATEMAEKGWSNLTEEQQDILSDVFGGQVARMQGLEREEEKFTNLRKEALIKQGQTVHRSEVLHHIWLFSQYKYKKRNISTITYSIRFPKNLLTYRQSD